MKLRNKKITILLLSVAMLITTVAGCGKVTDEDVVATVGKDKITVGTANFYTRFQQAQYETYYASFMGDDMWSSEVSDGVSYEENVKNGVLENLENMYLLKQHMKEYEVEITDEETEKIKNVAEQFFKDNSLESKKVVSGEKANVEEVLTLLTIQNKIFGPMTKDVDTEVTDEDAAQKSMQYVAFNLTSKDEEGNAKQLSDDEKVKLKEDATQFLESAKSADDLEAYAKESGYETTTATFDSESTTVNSELIKAADALGVGEFTGVVETDNAYYVGKVTSLLDREATDAKKESIINDRKQKAYDLLIEKWKKDTDIKVNKNVWDKISLKKQGVTMKQDEEQPYSNGASDTNK
ncbi:SurA N-terminal domain-containing protein [Lachnospiraceae bacterium LCP25S3_G4]